MPKISVILPVYNVEPYINRCFESLQNQTLSDLEFICIDDCSTDNSLKILKEYEKSDNRFKVIAQENNSGAAAARNRGLEIATGEYLSFIDPDDAIDLNFYEELYKEAKDKNVDVVKGNCKTITLDGETVKSNLNDNIKKSQSSYTFSYEWTTAIYRHEFIKKHNIKFPEECRKAQDIVFLSRIMYKHATLSLVNRVYYCYYRRRGSLNDNIIPIKSIKSALKAVELILYEINNSGLFETDINLYIENYFTRLSVIFYTLFQNNEFEAKKMCANALIESFYQCKDIEKLKIYFKYPWMLKYIEKRNVNGLARLFKIVKKEKLVQKPVFWYQKIFLIKNQIKGKTKHKVVTILGMKLKFKVGNK